MVRIKPDDTSFRLDADYAAHVARTISEETRQRAFHIKREPEDEVLQKPRLGRAIMECILLPRYEDVMRQRSISVAKGDAKPEGEGSVKAEPGRDEADLADFLLRSNTAKMYNRQRGDPPLSEEEIRQVALRLTNPAVKIKEHTQWSWDVVTDRLRVVGLDPYPVDLVEPTRSFTFKREYLHKLYGGNMQATQPEPNQGKAAIHGIKHFLCLLLPYNPHAPVVPGNPGLTMSSHSTMGRSWDDVQRVVVRVRDSAPALWQYMGQYRMYPSESLTPAEYMSQPLMVRKTWAKGTLEKDWGAPNCVRIHYRKVHGRIPTVQELTDVLEDRKRLTSIRNRLSEEDIMTAFERGEEENGIWVMKCIDYDAEFQRTLARNYRQYEQKLRAKAKVKTRAKPVTGKRKRESADPVAVKEEGATSGSDVEVIATSAKDSVTQDSDSDIEILD